MTQKISIQERMQNKAILALDVVEAQIDRLMDEGKSDFSMYKYLKQLDYSGKVVAYMKGFTEDTVFELENKEGCEQLEEACSFLSPTTKKRAI